jgi:hypothetical protein
MCMCVCEYRLASLTSELWIDFVVVILVVKYVALEVY